MNSWTKEDYVTFGDLAEETISEKLTSQLREKASNNLSHIEKYFRPLSPDIDIHGNVSKTQTNQIF